MPDRSHSAGQRRGAAAVLAALLLGACAGAQAPAPPGGAPYVRGPVLSIVSHATATGMQVGGAAGEACGIVATLDGRTRFLRRATDGALRPAALADVQVGDTVEVYVSGPVAESCPAQGYAASIVLAPRGAAASRQDREP